MARFPRSTYTLVTFWAQEFPGNLVAEMAFRALLFSKDPETNSAITAVCASLGIEAEICSDIFTAIEKVKTRSFSCVIPDWTDQPEAGFLLKRARESAPNRETLGIAIVDHEPSVAELHENRLDFVIFRPVSGQETEAVLAKACGKMRAVSVQDAGSPVRSTSSGEGSHAFAAGEEAQPQGHAEPPANLDALPAPEDSASDDVASAEEVWHEDSGRKIGWRGAVAVLVVLATAFCGWRSRDTIQYLSRTPEGASRVLKESWAAFFYMNKTGALPMTSAGSDAQQDAYFSRGPANSTTQAPTLGVAATESTLEVRIPLRKAFDFPLPEPVYEPPQEVPVRQVHAAIPDSMKNSPPIAPPVVVTVGPAQMMPVSAPVRSPEIQSISEPVTVSEEAARARLVHTVDPVYPQEGAGQKLHGAVVLQALIARDGSVEDLKLVRGYFALGKAAIAAVKQWKFQPYTVNGHAASTQTVITINFSAPTG